MKGDDETEQSPEDTGAPLEESATAPIAEEGPWRVSEPQSSPARHEPRESGAAAEPVQRAQAQAPAEQGHEEEEDSDGFTHEGLPEYEQDDPLAPAYDIEKGTPLQSHRQELPARSNIKNAKEFFNTELLYRFDILEDHERTELSGTYRIELKGFQGGVWTVQLGQSMDVVNRREDAEIVFTMQQSDFLQMVNGQLNPQLAMFAQKMRVNGDLKKAVAFQSLLSPEVD